MSYKSLHVKVFGNQKICLYVIGVKKISLHFVMEILRLPNLLLEKILDFCQNPNPTTTQPNKVGFDMKITLHHQHHHRELNVGNISAVTGPILMKL